MTDFRIAVMLNGSESIDYFEELTNLWRIFKSGLISDQSQNIMYYNVAGATSSSNPLFRVVMHLTGHGYSHFLDKIYLNLLDKIRLAYDLKQVTTNGTINISLFGFSDGATLARHFGTEYIKKRLIEEMPADIKAMGIKIKLDAEYLFDSVRLTPPSTVSVISRFALLNFRPASFYNPSIPYATKTYHAVALDEFDSEIEPLLVDADKESNEEVWFAGDHLDVGGGHMHPATKSPITAHHSLRYIVQRARENGLTFHQHFVDALKNEGNTTVLSEIHNLARELPFDERKVRDVYVQKDGEVSKDVPLIHESVLSRMQDAPRPYYQPVSLLSNFTEVKVLNKDGSRASARFQEESITPAPILTSYLQQKQRSKGIGKMPLKTQPNLNHVTTQTKFKCR